MVANPSGTRTPAFDRFCTISPSEAFLPPTCSRSASPSSANHSTFALIGCLLSVRVGQGLLVRLCRMTVDISSTDFAEELMMGRLWVANIASARRSSHVHCSREA